ncbi:MAG: hypothetical protein D6698_06755 [Gammaproteobacteria bacterium]|nr:MAG: hypothetical protein D6698_06755 [Gammaproteobacteria bacterium]
MNSLKNTLVDLIKQGNIKSAYEVFRDQWRSSTCSASELLNVELEALQDSGGFAKFFTPAILHEDIIEAEEPTEVVRPLLDEVPVNTFDAVEHTLAAGALVAHKVSPGQAPMESSTSLGALCYADMSKWGVSVRVSQETLDKGTPQMISRHVRLGARAIRRAVEKDIVDRLYSKATVSFDNYDTGKPSTTGRDGAGDYNGSVTADDLFKAYGDLLDNGYQANTLIVHPLMWIVFSEPSIYRLFTIPGSSQVRQPSKVPYVGSARGRSLEARGQFPANWNILLSPYVPIKKTSQGYYVSHILVCDIDAVGPMVVDSAGIRTNESLDRDRDLSRMSLFFRSGLALQEGTSVVIKNVSNRRPVDMVSNIVATIPAVNANLSNDPSLTTRVIDDQV